MSARDELGGILMEEANANGLYMGIITTDNMADAILAAGYRKPRTITTAMERAELKPGTICRDRRGNAWKRGTGSWVGTGEGGPLWDDEDLDLTILWEPQS